MANLLLEGGRVDARTTGFVILAACGQSLPTKELTIGVVSVQHVHVTSGLFDAIWHKLLAQLHRLNVI